MNGNPLYEGDVITFIHMAPWNALEYVVGEPIVYDVSTEFILDLVQDIIEEIMMNQQKISANVVAADPEEEDPEYVPEEQIHNSVPNKAAEFTYYQGYAKSEDETAAGPLVDDYESSAELTVEVIYLSNTDGKYSVQF